MPANEPNPAEPPLKALKPPLAGAFAGTAVELTGAKADLIPPGKVVAPNFGAKALGGGFVGVVDADSANTGVGVVDASPFLKKGEVSEILPNAPKPEAGLIGVDKLLNALAGGGWAGVVEVEIASLLIGDTGGDMSSSTGKADLTSTIGSGDDGGDPSVAFGVFPCPNVCVVPNAPEFPAKALKPTLRGAVEGFEGVVNGLGPVEVKAANPPDSAVVLPKDG